MAGPLPIAISILGTRSPSRPFHHPAASLVRCPPLGLQRLPVTARLPVLDFTEFHAAASECARFHFSIFPRPRQIVHSGALQRIPVHLHALREHCENLLAKVGVEGSNPFARSSFQNALRPRNSAVFFHVWPQFSTGQKSDFDGSGYSRVTRAVGVLNLPEGWPSICFA